MNLDLTGKTALVAGSSQGIGLAAATELAQLGCNLILCARNRTKLEAAKSDLKNAYGIKVELLIADFSKPADLERKLQALDSEVHILVNNTGGPPAGKAIDSSADQFQSAFDQHLKCNHILAQYCVPKMKATCYGRIINVISTSVKAPLAGLGVSNTIRGAVANWSKTLASELGEFGITVNNVLPGATETERLTSIIANKSEKSGKSIEEVTAMMAGQVPLARFAQPSEVGAAITFLASPAAAYISGVNLPVDGGRLKNL